MSPPLDAENVPGGWPGRCCATGVVQALAAVVMWAVATGAGMAQTNAPAEDTVNFVPTVAREAAAEGNAAYARGDYAKAEKAYERVLELVPDNLLGLVNLGMVKFSAGKPAEAEAHLLRAVQLQLDTPAAWMTLGILYMDAGRLDEALAALARVIVLEPRNARAHNYLGVVIGRKGWIGGAQDELRKAVEIDPNYSDAHYNLAVFCLQNTPPSTELARRHYFRAVELGAERDPDIEKTLKATTPP